MSTVSIRCKHCDSVTLSDGKCIQCGYGFPAGGQTFGFDPVNKPAHYGQGTIEAIDYIEDMLTKEEFIGYCRGSVAKYMHRWRYKNKEEDLKKARWYLEKLISTMEKE